MGREEIFPQISRLFWNDQAIKLTSDRLVEEKLNLITFMWRIHFYIDSKAYETDIKSLLTGILGHTEVASLSNPEKEQGFPIMHEGH